MSLKNTLLSAYNLEKRAPIQWGITHEKTAIQEYCKLFDVNVLETGKFYKDMLSSLFGIVTIFVQL